MRVISVLILIVLASCSSLPDSSRASAAAWCTSVEVTGRFTATDAQGRYLGVSDSALLAGATVEDIIRLIDRLCVD
jgi:hypothetical protein